MYEAKPDGEPVTPKDAATLILVRASSGAGSGLEIFCVERNKKSAFMGGAIVFPGGKLDPSDVVDEWTPLTTPPRVPQRGTVPFTSNEAHFRALAIAAARETLEEAAILPVVDGTLADAELLALRAELKENPNALRALLSKRKMRLDLNALHPFSRWITPPHEPRRFDTRFFITIAPEGQSGAHDEYETMSSFWASPEDILRRYYANEVTLMPPTLRTVQLIGECEGIKGVFALATSSNLDPIMPKVVREGEGDAAKMSLLLPGDPEHPVKEQRIGGTTRYVLRDGRFFPEDAPART